MLLYFVHEIYDHFIMLYIFMNIWSKIDDNFSTLTSLKILKDQNYCKRNKTGNKNVFSGLWEITYINRYKNN